MAKVKFLNGFQSKWLWVLVVLLPTVSIADITVDKSILRFDGQSSKRQDVVVSNLGDDTAYVQVTPYLIKNPGMPNEVREKIKNPKSAGLLVSPSKLALAGGGRKLVRFVNLNPTRPEEGVYRVAIEPVAGPVDASQTGLMVLVGYEVLVLAAPADEKPDLVAERNGRTLTLNNRGNVNLYFWDGKQCAGSDQDCEPLGDKRLYPGTTVKMTLPRDLPVEFQIAQGTQSDLKRVP